MWAAFELPPGAPTVYTLRSPWQEERERPAFRAEAGQPLRMSLQPYQVVVFDATPVRK